MLSGAVAGRVFASPSANIILSLITAVTGPAGCLVIVKNYTGDRLTFGIAVEKARARGLKVELIVVSDDVTLLDHDVTTGARGLCGTLFLHKILGAAAEEGKSLDELMAVAREMVGGRIRTAGVASGPCVPPGREPSFVLPPGVMEFGVGIHGEAGAVRSNTLQCSDIVFKLLEYLYSSDTDQKFINKNNQDNDKWKRIDAQDRKAIIVNNLGGTSQLEMGVVVGEVVKAVQHLPEFKWLSWGTFMTSLGMHGVSITTP
eukprot:sb/3468496/